MKMTQLQAFPDRTETAPRMPGLISTLASLHSIPFLTTKKEVVFQLATHFSISDIVAAGNGSSDETEQPLLVRFVQTRIWP